MYFFGLEKLLYFLLLGQTHNEINIFLSSYNIYSFLHRFAGRILAWIQIHYNAFQIHYDAHISGISEPRMKRMIPDEIQQMELELKLLIQK
jgi:hypothetical protein